MQKQQNNITPDLTPKEVAATLNIHLKTVYDLMKRGALENYHVGRARRIRYESVQAIRDGNAWKMSENLSRYRAKPKAIDDTGVHSSPEGLKHRKTIKNSLWD